MIEGPILALVLVGLSFPVLYFNDKYIKTRLWRKFLWWKVPRMDVRSEERAWERVADRVLDEIDAQFLGWRIDSSVRQSMLKKLRNFPGLRNEFEPQRWQSLLKEAIRERLGTHTRPRFPDPGPYVFAYSSIIVGDRSKSTLVLLKMRTGAWRTKGP